MVKMVSELDEYAVVMGRPVKPMPTRDEIVAALNAGYSGKGEGKDYVTRIAKAHFGVAGGTLRKWMQDFDIKRSVAIIYS